MKISTLFFLLFISLHCFSQTEKETVEFINTKFAENYAELIGPAIWKVNTKTADAKKEIIITLSCNGSTTTYLINPKNINSITTYKAPAGNMNIKIISLTNSIKKDAFKSTSFENEINIVLKGSDEEIIRIKKGLIHLFKLYGSSFANDDLFKE